MDGTTGNVTYNEYLERKKAREIKARKGQLALNRALVKKAIITALGWEKLEPFAEQAINNALASKMVDVEKLIADLKAWQEGQNDKSV